MNHNYVLFVSQKELVRAQHKFKDLPEINVEYFKGIIGAKDPRYITYYNDYYKGNKQGRMFLKPGEFGHVLSFLNILNDAKEKGYEYITVYEPDIYFCNGYCEKLTELMATIKEWDILYLGSMQGFYFGQSTWEKVALNTGTNYYKCHKSLGTFAIAIRSSMYEPIIEALGKYNEPTDVCLVTLQDKYNCFVAYPNLVCSDVSSSGTNQLQRPKNHVEYMQKYRWNPADYVFTDVFIVPSTCTGKIVITLNSKLPGSSITVRGDQTLTVKEIVDPPETVTVNIGSGQYYVECRRCFLNGIK